MHVDYLGLLPRDWYWKVGYWATNTNFNYTDIAVKVAASKHYERDKATVIGTETCCLIHFLEDLSRLDWRETSSATHAILVLRIQYHSR